MTDYWSTWMCVFITSMVVASIIGIILVNSAFLLAKYIANQEIGLIKTILDVICTDIYNWLHLVIIPI